MPEYEHHETRESWLEHRSGHIGASEAGAILGMGPMSRMELWKLKTGRAEPKDLSDNERVAYGNRAEDALRRLFAAKHPELTVTHKPFDYVYQKERPWLRATLDGELTENGTGRRGALEIKTALCSSRADWEQWRDRIPDKYLAQITHQFCATGFDFIFVFAELMSGDGHSELREYLYLRERMEESMEYLLKEEERFWQCVERDTVPGAVLRI